ncbi:hypothetical protein [Rickettsia massiliae]|uniref:hypothetical protein n=1 Tax=Rickettsia massiliae TaxID=35791 RepID=UPI0018C8D02E|nr:hypothetical protein [Rickettsia massiliae]
MKKIKKYLLNGMRIKTLTLVEWQVTSISSEETFVTITNTGFIGDEVVKQIIFSAKRFILVLAGAKAFLEHNIILNLVIDRFTKKID